MKKVFVLSIIIVLSLLMIGSAKAYLCYQEAANASQNSSYDGGSTSSLLDGNCGIRYTGSYTGTDETGANSSHFIYINYTKPEYANDNSLWQIQTLDTFVTTNYSIPNQCFAQNPLQLSLYSGGKNIDPGLLFTCYNGTDWQTLQSVPGLGGNQAISPGSYTYIIDGLWNTQGSCFWTAVDGWKRGGYPNCAGNSMIDEEAMWWSISEGTFFENSTTLSGTSFIGTNNNPVIIFNSTATGVGLINLSIFIIPPAAAGFVEFMAVPNDSIMNVYGTDFPANLYNTYGPGIYTFYAESCSLSNCSFSENRTFTLTTPPITPEQASINVSTATTNLLVALIVIAVLLAIALGVMSGLGVEISETVLWIIGISLVGILLIIMVISFGVLAHF